MIKFPFPLPARYEPTGERLGGGQGYVYVCKDSYLDRNVAIKVMHSKGDGVQLKRELRALCDIRSRHVAQVYELVTSKGGTLGLVQEFISGEPLDEYALKDSISIDEYIKILYQVASGLADIHSRGKVHRDIKPHNLKFDSENVVKILDFGLIADLLVKHETTKARGTDGFLAPEFFHTPPMAFSSAADAYAFGVTAWFLANKGELPDELLEDPPQTSRKAPSFGALSLPIPPEIVALLDSTLVVSARARPSMPSVKETIERRLLYGKHRAIFSVDQRRIELVEPGKSVVLRSATGSLTVHYDGLSYRVIDATGDAYVNNAVAPLGSELPKSSVVTLGADALGSSRTFIAVDTSHPEVVL
jgi:serine/threonine protein kinase